MNERNPPGGQGEPVMLRLPFDGRWLAQNSPARRVPSHGTDLLGGRYAIDFVGVDSRHRTAFSSDWRTLAATEPPDRFIAWGQPVLAPAGGVVVGVHDGEPDHAARRSQLALLPYALGQPARLRQGVAAVAGNHVVIRLGHATAFVALAHLRAGSIDVAPGEEVSAGQRLAACGNSGNSTQPHLHLQVMDGLDASTARGLPMAFARFREWPRGPDSSRIRDSGLPQEGAVVMALPPDGAGG